MTETNFRDVFEADSDVKFGDIKIQKGCFEILNKTLWNIAKTFYLGIVRQEWIESKIWNISYKPN